jgi:hypothetical protein
VTKHILMTALLAAAATAYPMHCLAEGQDWYPKATDSCAEFLAQFDKPRATRGKLVTPTKDPVIAKYVLDFNAATGTNDQGAIAFGWLISYCAEHGFKKLGDVKAQDVVTLLNSENAAAPSNARPAEKQKAAQPTSQDAMLKCLQDTAKSIVTNCRNSSCDASSLINRVRLAQQAFCGYSAIEPIQPTPLSPNPTNCITSPTPGGGWITTCM